MSSFVMSAKSLSIIAHAIMRVSGSSYGHRLGMLLDACVGRHSSKHTSERVFDALLEFNIERVKLRYPDDDYEYGSAYEPDHPVVNLWQVVLLMECFLYQCSEGPAYSESCVFKLVYEAAAAIRDEIVSNLPEYKNAHWSDIPDTPSENTQAARPAAVSQTALW